MTRALDPARAILSAWRTNNRATTFLSYFAAHEGHHRGQLFMAAARQLGHRLPRAVAGGVWQWTRFARE